jgi:hypothetical protein
VLLTGQASAPTMSRISPSSPGKGYGLVMSLKSRGTSESLMNMHQYGVQGCVGVGLSLSAPSSG